MDRLDDRIRRDRKQAVRLGDQHPRQTFFIFAFSFELSSASTSASGRWLRVLDPEVAWSGILDPGCLECSATQAGGPCQGKPYVHWPSISTDIRRLAQLQR